MAAGLRVRVVTLMPELVASLRHDGIIGGAIKAGRIELESINPRSFTEDRHATVDDEPYGGGPGMVLKPEPLAAAIDAAKRDLPSAQVWCMAVDGARFGAAHVEEISLLGELILVCGRYQGIDERVVESRVDRLVSMGDFISSGGELPAMLIIDAAARMVPEVLGNSSSLEKESLSGGGLAAPCYTRPRSFEGMEVPEVLLSGDHGMIERWREGEAARRTDAWKRLRSRESHDSEEVSV